MLHNAQDANRRRQEEARRILGDIKSRSIQERYESRKKFQESAGMAGVATISQSDIDYIELNILAFDNLGASFIEMADLEFGQAAIYKNRTVYPTRVNIGNLAGGPPTSLFMTAQSATQVQPFQFFSEEYLVPNLVNAAFDLGKFDEKQKALERVAHDIRLAKQKYIMNMALGQVLSTPLATAVTNYLASSPFNNRTVWVPDAEIASGALPTTNVFDLSSTELGLTRNVFKKIRTYTNQAHRVPRSLFIPVAGTPWEAYWDQASIVGYSAVGQSNLDTSRAIPQSKWDEAVGMAFELNGAYMNWFGMDVFVQPVDVLPSGACLLSTDQPSVLGWNQMEATVSDEEKAFGQRAQNRRYEARSMALAQPDAFVPHQMAIKIGTGG